MKKRIISVLLSVSLLISLCMFSGCSTGIAGKSAYEIAVDHGFAGTEEEWLESLKASGNTSGNNSQTVIGDIVINTDGYTGAEYAANRGLMSAVSIYTHFQKTVSYGGGFFGRPGVSSPYDFNTAG